MESSVTPRKPYLVIRPPVGWAALDLRELWLFRDLLFTLAGRDLKLRYRQTALGVAWVVLQPLLLSGVFTIIFSVIARLSTDGIPGFVFSFAGMMGWTVFSTMISKGGTSLVGNAHLVSKVYFPRLALPLSIVFSTLVDFAIMLAIMAVLMAWYRIVPGIEVLLLPLWIFLFLALGTGLGLIAGALTVSYRDVQYVLPVLVSFLQLASPIAYATTTPKPLPAWLFPWYMLNPLAGLLEASRWSLLSHGGTLVVHWGYVEYAAAMSIAVLVVGMALFKRMERRFADVI